MFLLALHIADFPADSAGKLYWKKKQKQTNVHVDKLNVWNENEVEAVMDRKNVMDCKSNEQELRF